VHVPLLLDIRAELRDVANEAHVIDDEDDPVIPVRPGAFGRRGRDCTVFGSVPPVRLEVRVTGEGKRTRAEFVRVRPADA
jgi:hypothetical protein